LLSRGSTPRGTVAGYARGATTATVGGVKRVNFRIPAMKGTKRKGSMKTCKSITKKPKVAKKFRVKVEKVLRYNDPWFKYQSVHNIHLYQAVKDQYGFFYADERGFPLYENNARQALHHISVGYYSKADTDNYDTTTGNAAVTQKINQISYRTDYFFKSTSNHVVNLEMFICTAKTDLNNTQYPYLLMTNSYTGDYDDLLTYVTTGQATTTGTMGVSDLGAKPDEWVELYKYWNVKSMKFKIQPGDYCTHSIVQKGGKTFDLSEKVITGTIDYISKGTKAIVFRVINDISVSVKGVEDEGRIHAFSSSNQGGLACRFTRTAMYRSPPIGTTAITQTSSRNVIRRSQWERFDATTDQQVLLANPITTATIGP